MTIQLPLDSAENASCLGGIFSRFTQSRDTIPDDSNEKFVYSNMSPMQSNYDDIITENMNNLDIEYTQDIRDRVNTAIDNIDSELRNMSIDIHENPETSMKEYFAHDLLTEYLEKKGFQVTRHAYGIETAFLAEYSNGEGRRVGVCSEYDALPGLGQGCGHNLIAISGVATAIAIKEVLESNKASGKVVLFGTPGEEISIGKISLIRKRAFQDNVDVCLMLHPTAFDHQYAVFIAVHDVRVEFFGKASHASASPWEGINALDAMVQVWNGMSYMRQELLPTDRVHGIVTNGGQAPNVIPEYTSAFIFVRTARAYQIEPLMKKLENIFEAAALATGCKVKYTWREGDVTKDVVQNEVMACTYADEMRRYGIQFSDRSEQEKTGGGSTDMGNVSYEMPVIHPAFGIHTTAANHTVEFTKAAKTIAAHKNTLVASKCLAMTGVRVLLDEEYYNRVQRNFDGSQMLTSK